MFQKLYCTYLWVCNRILENFQFTMRWKIIEKKNQILSASEKLEREWELMMEWNVVLFISHWLIWDGFGHLRDVPLAAFKLGVIEAQAQLTKWQRDKSGEKN